MTIWCKDIVYHNDMITGDTFFYLIYCTHLYSYIHFNVCILYLVSQLIPLISMI